ncbi:COX15/CtaA family protein [bacterium]|nr:COX15/CtaA family protein [bacterium]
MTNEAPLNSTKSQASPDGGASGVPSKAERRLTYALWGLLALLFLLVLAGGTVRLTGSGLSIPEWPIIYYGENKTDGSVLPPHSDAAWQTAYETYHHEVIHKHRPGEWISMGQFKREFWTEYTHRAIAAFFGFLFLGTLIWTFTNPTLRHRVGGLFIGAIVVLILQIILGGTVVRTHTPALMVAFHLSTAFVFVALILWAQLRLHLAPGEKKPAVAPRLTKLAWIVLALAFLQIFSGGIVAKTHAGKHYNTWPMMGEQLVPVHALWDTEFDQPIRNLTENIVLIQFFHRWFAFLVLIGVAVLVTKSLGQPLTRSGRWVTRALATVTVLQILIGIFTLLEAVPYRLGILHLGTGLVLFLLLVVMVFEIRHNHAILAFETEKAQETGKAGVNIEQPA